MVRGRLLGAVLLSALAVGCEELSDSERAYQSCVDQGLVTDADGDGHVVSLCGGDDCDDGDPDTYLDAPEECDDVDQDCDGRDDELEDDDGDGMRLCSGGECDDENPTVNHHAEEVPDGVDNDCDGQIDE